MAARYNVTHISEEKITVLIFTLGYCFWPLHSSLASVFTSFPEHPWEGSGADLGL